jgi:large subunit ribosomal protein L24e
MTVDSTFEFEKRRNRPTRYNRDTMSATLSAMKRVGEIQEKRNNMFYNLRMRAHKATKQKEMRIDIEKGIEVLAPAAANKEKALAIATGKIKDREAKKAKQKKSKDKMEVDN